MVQEQVKTHKEAMESVIATIADLTEQKKAWLAKCQDAIEAVQNHEKKLDIAIKQLYRDCDQRIERDRKIFRSTADERNQKFLQQKLIEFKELTRRGLEPEIRRIKAMHERELTELHQNYDRNLTDMKESLTRRYAMSLEERGQELQFEHQNVLKRLELSFLSDEKLAENEHTLRMTELKDELLRQLHREKAQWMQRLEHEREQHQREINKFHDDSKERIQAIKSKHSEEIKALEHEYDVKV